MKKKITVRGLRATKTYRVSIVSPVSSAAFQTRKTLRRKREKKMFTVSLQVRLVKSSGSVGKSPLESGIILWGWL